MFSRLSNFDGEELKRQGATYVRKKKSVVQEIERFSSCSDMWSICVCIITAAVA